MTNLRNILIKKINCKSVWFMRQAGRYLPEFRKIRSKNSDFIKLCLDSELSSILTLQPIERYDLDSAIIFSDILMIPHALGQKVTFTKNEGPKLGKFCIKKLQEAKSTSFTKSLIPIYKAIEITRKRLNKKKSLICFVGAPWTLLIYILSIKDNQNKLILEKITSNEEEIERIINLLIKFICIHIENQINAGADVVQIFDSWAGIIPKNKIEKYCYEPNKKIVDFCKNKNIPTICFPKGIKDNYRSFNLIVKPNGLNLDSEIDPNWAKDNLKNVVLQGGLNPRILFEEDAKMLQAATKYIQIFNKTPYVFNLGHGLLPETDPDNVKKLINFYRNF